MLPASLADTIADALGAPPHRVQMLGVQDWSHTARCVVHGQQFVIKWQPSTFAVPNGWPSVVAAEAHGLRRLAAAQAVRVPQVVMQGERQDDRPAFMLMEWIEQGHGDRREAGRMLGTRLAALHRLSAPTFGLDQHNYCGATPQSNTPTGSWITFYGQQRLGVQMELAAQNGYLPAARRRRLEWLIERLGEWIDDRAVQPSLIHGDLWGGNWLVNPASQPVLIDPAVYFADREMELAMCHLFGGFPPEFFHAYDDAWPPTPGRDERIPLYQLYHLLNHLNIFGEAYGAQVDRVLQRLVA